MTALLAAGGGFLLAVLWMDLLFDVQVLRHRRGRELPEDVLASIAGYYRRVTTTARPLGHLVGAVMAVTVAGAAVQLVRGAGSRRATLAALALCAAPAALAIGRVLPNAVRLGTRRDPPLEQSALARSICRDHLLCLASIGAFVALQIARALSCDTLPP